LSSSKLFLVSLSKSEVWFGKLAIFHRTVGYLSEYLIFRRSLLNLDIDSVIVVHGNEAIEREL